MLEYALLVLIWCAACEQYRSGKLRGGLHADAVALGLELTKLETVYGS